MFFFRTKSSVPLSNDCTKTPIELHHLLFQHMLSIDQHRKAFYIMKSKIGSRLHAFCTPRLNGLKKPEMFSACCALNWNSKTPECVVCTAR